MYFQPCAQCAAPNTNTGSVGSCDYWCKGKFVLPMCALFPGKREVSGVCMGCQAHSSGSFGCWGRGREQPSSGQEEQCAVLGGVGIVLDTTAGLCAPTPAEPHPYEPPNPISAFLSSLHKAAVEVPCFLKESLRVFFQSPQEALLRDVAQPMLSGCTQWQSAEPGVPPAHLSGLGAVSVCWIINVREVTWLPLQLPVAAQPFLSLSVSSMAE